MSLWKKLKQCVESYGIYLLPKSEKRKNGKYKKIMKDLAAGLLVVHVVGSKILLKQGSAKGLMTSSMLVTKSHCKD
jgi:hypothetical protein